MKKIISLVAVIMLLISCTNVLTISAFTGSSSLYFSSNSVTVGDTMTVTVGVKASNKIYGIKFVINYDPSILEFVDGDGLYSGGAGVISVTPDISSTSGSFKYTFKAIKAGSCVINTSDIVISDGTEEPSLEGQSATFTVKDASLSDNANLKSLSVSEGSLSPSFSASKTSYTVSVGRSVTDCKIYATAADSGATVQVSGGSDLKIGKNDCTVTVTAPSGTQKTYKIVITRLETDTSSDTSSDTESTVSGTLDTEIDGTVYTVAQNIDSVALPNGFSAKKVLYNDIEVAVAEDANGEYTIYYLGTSDSDQLVPYTLNTKTNVFEKLQYFKQAEFFYIFAEIPEGYDMPDGYYATNTQISDFNVSCYSSSNPELASFYYIYCFTGEDYGFYRYDSLENVLQRYPEITLVAATDAELKPEGDGFIARFNSLTTNAKVAVIGFLLIILAVLALIILFVLRLIYHRNSVELTSDMDYQQDFDNVNYGTSFSIETDNFVTEDDEDVKELDFGDEDAPQEPDSDYITEDGETKE